MKNKSKFLVSLLTLILIFSLRAFSQTTVFTYQGKLSDAGMPPTGTYQMEFRLFDAPVGGQLIGQLNTNNAVSVTAGVFTVNLNFGDNNSFPGPDRFLQISVRRNSGESFVTLNPRQMLTSTPYAIRTLSALQADDSNQLGGVGALQYLRTNGDGSGLTNLNAGSITTGTVNNARLGQIPTANIAESAVTSAKIAPGQVVKSLNGLADNLTLAAGANISITPSANTLTIASTGTGGIGGSGTANTVPLWTGGSTIGNSVISQSAGRVGVGTASPSAHLHVVGSASGIVAVLGEATATGAVAVGGSSSNGTGVSGSSNLGIGVEGTSRSGGIGVSASNAFSGGLALRALGSSWFRGDTNALGSAITGPGTGIVVGSTSNFGYISAYDYSATQARTLSLNHFGGNVGIGTNIPAARLEVVGGSSVAIRASTSSSSVADPAISGTNFNGIGVFGQGGGGIFGAGVRGSSSTGTGVNATALDRGGIALRTQGSSWFSGDSTPLSVANTGSGTGIVIGSSGTVGYITAYDYSANQPRTLRLNDAGGNVGIGTTTPDQALSVNGNASKSVGGGSWANFSDERLKNIKGRFGGGLKAVMKLQPLRYEYKTDNAIGLKSEGEHVGFSAQAVEKLIPEAVTKTEQGYRLVNNDPIIWTMLNAIKEQQKQIERLTSEVRRLKTASRAKRRVR